MGSYRVVAGQADVMTLNAEAIRADAALREAATATLRAVTKLGAQVQLVERGSPPNDGRIIADKRVP